MPAWTSDIQVKTIELALVESACWQFVDTAQEVTFKAIVPQLGTNRSGKARSAGEENEKKDHTHALLRRYERRSE
jgi:hypothetical protein